MAARKALGTWHLAETAEEAAEETAGGGLEIELGACLTFGVWTLGVSGATGAGAGGHRGGSRLGGITGCVAKGYGRFGRAAKVSG